MEQQAREFIQGFFLEKSIFSDAEKERFLNVNFVELGLLDSIQFITLIAEIEERFNILFTEEDIQSPLFSSIEGMVKITGQRIKTENQS